MAEQYYDMTLAGVTALKEELEHRKVTMRMEISERIKVALSFGDLSENSEYDDAKMEQGENEARIAEIEATLKNARVIDEKDISKTQVTLGSSVLLRDEENGDELTFLMVSSKEEDILSNKISTDSPVGQAIMGKKKNQVAEVQAPAGTINYKILKISRPE